LRFCIRPLNGTFVFLAIMDIRAHPVSFSERPREAGRATRSRMRRRDRFSISSFQLADLGGKANYCYRDQFQTLGGGHPLSGCGRRDARLIAALLCQHGPSDPRQRSQILPLAQREPREWRRVVAPPALMAGLSPAQRSTGYRRANLTTTQTASP
jgi:hypothetical protein